MKIKIENYIEIYTTLYLTWLCVSSFFLTLMGLSSISSSRLTLDATLESALMTFEADTVVLPSRLDEMPVSSDELGVT